MKNSLAGLILVLATTACSAQTVNLTNYAQDYYNQGTIPPEGTYVKDVDGYLNQFIGTWEAQIDSNDYVLYIRKGTKTTRKGVKHDMLFLTYQIKPSSGESGTLRIEDTREVTEDDPLMVWGSHALTNGTYAMVYQGRDPACGQSGYLYLEQTEEAGNSFQLYFSFLHNVIYEDQCPNGVAQVLFPEKSTIFKKIE